MVLKDSDRHRNMFIHSEIFIGLWRSLIHRKLEEEHQENNLRDAAQIDTRWRLENPVLNLPHQSVLRFPYSSRKILEQGSKSLNKKTLLRHSYLFEFNY